MIRGQDLIDRGYIPHDKSLIIRMAVLDLLARYKGRKYNDGIEWMGSHYHELNDDSRASHDASIDWINGNRVRVGEAGTLYRMLWLSSEKLFSMGLISAKKEFVRGGTLVGRDLGDTQDKVYATFDELLKLDTTQWASAYMLFSFMFSEPVKRVYEVDPKIDLTFDAIENWDSARKSGVMWEPKYDSTILRQNLSYLQWLREGDMDYPVTIREEYPHGRAFGKMTAEEAKKWPGLRKHESDRIGEMEENLDTCVITSKDHRVVKAIAMLKRDKIFNGEIRVLYPDCVRKSDPFFFRFLEDAPKLAAA